ncbi:MAG: T9SS type A sorting domain-containing protein [Flavobacteriales bacterium]|nr:T9SS type A sorting domain-containing protein [Flavobacteriales bacterium]
MIRTLTLTLLVTALAPAAAQTVQKCCGTSNSTFLLGNLGTAPHTQSLYLPGDLTNAAAGEITRLYYRYGTTGVANGNTLGDLLVRMGQTTATTFSGGTTFFTGLDTVLQLATFDIPPGTSGDWFVIHMQTPFLFDPAQTLIVDIHFTTSTTTNFGCYGTTNNDRKLYSLSPTDITGITTSTTWQDIGFDLNTGTGLDDADALRAAVFPNPAADVLMLQVDGGTPTAVEVLDMQGRPLPVTGTAPRSAPMQLDVAALPAGLYLVRVHSDDGRTGQARWMKQ